MVTILFKKGMEPKKTRKKKTKEEKVVNPVYFERAKGTPIYEVNLMAFVIQHYQENKYKTSEWRLHDSAHVVFDALKAEGLDAVDEEEYYLFMYETAKLLNKTWGTY